MSILKRKGKLSISTSTIYEAPQAVQAVLRDAIIVRAEMEFMTEKVNYDLMHPLFREVELGMLVPTYEAIFETNDEGEITVKFNEQEYP